MNGLAGREIRTAYDPPKSGIYGGCNFDVGAGHWREYGDFFGGEYDFLKPLPFPESDRMFLVARTNNRIGGANISWPIYLAWKEKQGLFDALGIARPGGTTTLTGRGDAEQIPAYVISSEVLAVLGVRPELGRGFQADEAKIGGPRAVLISDALWRRKFVRGNYCGTNNHSAAERRELWKA